MNDEVITERAWSVGELARQTGLTVRTLHHYDELGLLRPSERTYAGHRRYATRDVQRLYEIVALRRLGLELRAIGELLDGRDADLPATLARQLAQVDAQIAAQGRLRALLVGIRDRLDAGHNPRVEDILNAIEETTMIERHYTPEQLERLAGRRAALGEDAIKAVEREWGEIFAALRTAMGAGTDPADPSLRRHAERGQELVAMFTGGEPDIEQSLASVWRDEDPAKVSHGMVDRDVMEYYGRVQAAAGQ